MGAYANLLFPTGHTSKLSGVGSTSLGGGVLLSQRFDDLTFAAPLGTSPTKDVEFADAFSLVIEYSAGLYMPLDWPHWLAFTEVIGLLNATERNVPGTEPLGIWWAHLR